MRRSLILLTLLAVASFAPPASAKPLSSDNVSLVTKLPEALGAASAKFSPDGRTMYVSTWKGLHVYDITTPDDPKRVGVLPLPHFENEDVDAGNGVVIISNDPSEGLGLIYVIDVRDPRVPTIRSVIRNGDILGVTNELGLDPTQSNTGHIANCLQGCKWLWTTGTEEGVAIFDLRDLDHPKFVKLLQLPAGKATGEPGFTHDVQVDKTGIAWITGRDGTFGYSTEDPANPKLLYRSDEDVVNSGNDGPNSPDTAQDYPLDFLHHNSMRVSGGVLAVTEEDYTRPTCNGQGSLQTWQMWPGHRNADGSTKLRLLDQWTTELNGLETQTGRSPATVLCSAHWFDESRGLLAQGWYDQGVRFLDVSNPRKIEQVGYWVTTGTFWGAYFAPSDPRREVVYGLDVAGGIDVLRIDRGGRRGTQAMTKARAPIARRWRTGAGRLGSRRVGAAPSAQWGFACPLTTPLHGKRI